VTTAGKAPLVTSFPRRLHGAAGFFGVAAILALVFHVAFVSMTGGNALAAFDGETLLYFGLPVLAVPAMVALAMIFGPQHWRRNGMALFVAMVAMLLHGVAVVIWIGSLTDGLSQAYGIIFLAPALLGWLTTALALPIARPYRR
jgi:uncharacterized membrane protein